jgi:hypothetical protein
MLASDWTHKEFGRLGRHLALKRHKHGTIVHDAKLQRGSGAGLAVRRQSTRGHNAKVARVVSNRWNDSMLFMLQHALHVSC